MTGGQNGAPTGRARVGRAQVPGQHGAAGRATVGRASVRTGSSAGAFPGGDVIERPGTGRQPPPGSPPSPATAARRKRARRRNWILGGFALIIMLAGSTVVGGTFLYDDVGLPQNLPQRDQSTTIYYADNKTEMGKIGNENRTIIPGDQISRDVRNAVVATEDKTFYKNSGISYKGILRAAWNNFTGGNRQGASTITQQYARAIAELKGITYSRKLREAVMAMKLNDNYKKDDILTAYLNTVYFGRQSYGIEAAAQAYFGKHAKDLNVAEGMALAALIKDPAGGPNGLSPYDGTANLQAALARFDGYIKPTMVQMKFMSAADAAALKYPDMRKYNPADPAYSAEWGLNTPTGNVMHNVVDELTHAVDAKGKQLFPDLKTGGYRIVTTINSTLQAQAVKYGSGQVQGSPLPTAKAGAVAGVKPEENKVAAAIVTVEPYSGRVLAYYGGSDGGQPDQAGVWRDPLLPECKDPVPKPTDPEQTCDRLQGFGRHRAASSFKVYTLGAALKSGISINSFWDAPPSKTYPKDQNPVRNAEQTTSCEGGKVCRLWEATAESLNVPFYDVAAKVGPTNVLEFARDAGIKHIWNLDGTPKRYDLNSTGPVTDQLNDPRMGIGQYAITVLDHASGVASVAARGAKAPTHFVSQVYKGSTLIYKETFKPTQIPGYSQAMADDESFALQKVLQQGTGKGLQLTGGRVAAVKTGTWQAQTSQNDFKNDQNSNAWMVGYVAPDLARKPQFYGLATAVWMGAVKGDSVPITLGKSPMFGSTGPGKIWKPYMDAVTAGMPKTTFPAAKNVGDDSAGTAQPPQSQTPADPNNGNCTIPVFCQDPGGQGGGGNGGGNGNGNGNGNGGGGQGGGIVPSIPPTPPRRR